MVRRTAERASKSGRSIVARRVVSPHHDLWFEETPRGYRTSLTDCAISALKSLRTFKGELNRAGGRSPATT